VCVCEILYHILVCQKVPCEIIVTEDDHLIQTYTLSLNDKPIIMIDLKSKMSMMNTHYEYMKTTKGMDAMRDRLVIDQFKCLCIGILVNDMSKCEKTDN